MNATPNLQLRKPAKMNRVTLLVFGNISTEYYMAPGGVLCNLLAPNVNHPIDTIQTYNVLYIL